MQRFDQRPGALQVEVAGAHRDKDRRLGRLPQVETQVHVATRLVGLVGSNPPPAGTRQVAHHEAVPAWEQRRDLLDRATDRLDGLSGAEVLTLRAAAHEEQVVGLQRDALEQSAPVGFTDGEGGLRVAQGE